jgi:ABC-type dipeptide/oligopeptide/nickel transport system permease component
MTVVWKHAFRNALIAPLTHAGLLLVGLLTGSVVTETVFAWPGIGRLAVTSVTQNDYPVVSGVILIFTVMYVAAALLTDALYAVIDPRIRLRAGN